MYETLKYRKTIHKIETYLTPCGVWHRQSQSQTTSMEWLLSAKGCRLDWELLLEVTNKLFDFYIGLN